MKAMGIIGIVLSGYMILSCIYVIASESITWPMGAITILMGFFLALSILVVKNSK